MYAAELNSFLYKFHQLSFSGLEAHLDLHSHAGNAWVGLRLNLGKVPSPWFESNKNYNSPSRQKRRAKRAAEREAKRNESEPTEKVDDDSLFNEHENNAAEKVDAVENEIDNFIVPEKETGVIEEFTVAEEAKDSAEQVDSETSEQAIKHRPHPVVPAEKAVLENVVGEVAGKAATDQTQQKIAEKQPDKRRRWLCLLHGCIGEEFDSYDDIECDCCKKGCEVVEYKSDEDHDDTVDPT